MDRLKQNILLVIKDNNYSINDLTTALKPISNYTDNTFFKDNIKTIVDIITKDRDGNNKFTIDDLKYLSNDIIGISSLITALLLIIGGIPDIKLKYEPEVTEELVFKLLAFIFLVVIPKQTGHPWTYDEKVAVLDLALLVYQLIKSSQVVKDLCAKVIAWFKSKNFCKCTADPNFHETVVEKNLPGVKLELIQSMNTIKEKSAMNREIQELKKGLKTLNKKN